MSFAALGCAGAQALNCDLTSYKPADGLGAALRGETLEVVWRGDHDTQLRVSFTIRTGNPVIEEMAVRKPAGTWAVLGRNLAPEFQVTSGKRRMSEQQLAPLRALGIPLTPDFLEREKWNAFWDAPLQIPGNPGTNMDLPRRPEEIRRAWASYHASSCTVKTDGARLEITFPGLEMSIFSGDLRYTIYRGTNLLRQEAVAKTEQPSVAYKYIAGLKGFAIHNGTRVDWQDTARNWQAYEFGGTVNQDPVALKARNRLVFLDNAGGSVAAFPPSHKFFFAREIETNLGFVYYRKDSNKSFAIGVRQADREEGYPPYGVSDAVWNRRANESRHDANNFALYNAPPGTWQHMPVYFYLSPDDSRSTQQAVLAFTHGDTYKAIPGYQILVSHFHMHFNEQLTDAGSMDLQPTWFPVFRGLGINMVILADFHSDSHPSDPGPIRFPEQRVYFEGCRRFSDRNFLLIPGEEPDANLGGHYMFVFPRPLFWSHDDKPGAPFKQQDEKYGIGYHSHTAEDELRLLEQQNGYMWQTHPRTKGSAGYPDAVRNKPHFLSDRFIGGSYQSLPVDQSQKRLCEARCLGLLNDMNNWSPLKYMIAEGDTYMKNPEDETYPELLVNYVKLDRVPSFDEGWGALLSAMRKGDFFVTSGEVLLQNARIEGSGNKRNYCAEVEWTFPLDFVELVWGDGTAAHTQEISATDLPAFGKHTFEIPFDTSGKKWIRFGAWDSAGNGAFTQPVLLQ